MNVDGYLRSYLSYVTGNGDDAVSGVFSRASSTGALTFVEVQKDGVNGVDGLAAATQVGKYWQWLPSKDRCLDMFNLIPVKISVSLQQRLVEKKFKGYRKKFKAGIAGRRLYVYILR